MQKYKYHSLALRDQEEKDFLEIKERTGFGVKKIFMAMIQALKPSSASVMHTPSVVHTPEQPVIVEEE